MPSSATATAATACRSTGPVLASSTTPRSTSTTRSFPSAPATSCGWRRSGSPNPEEIAILNSRSFRRAALALAFAAAAATPAFAQRVIHLVVPFGPGAVQDTVARTFNAELGQALGATVVVENRPGAGGTVGTSQVAKATDNNTLVLAAASHTLAGHLYSKLDYDPIKDFTAVAYIGNSGYAIAAPGNLGVNHLAEYVKLLKSKPGQMNYASAGNGSATHM